MSNNKYCLLIIIEYKILSMQCNINIIVRVASGGGRRKCHIQHKNLYETRQLLLLSTILKLLRVCQSGRNFCHYPPRKIPEPK